MFKKDIDVVAELHGKHCFKGPLLDAGGVKCPIIADYSISMAKAVKVTMPDGRIATLPHTEQSDRYVNISRPWSFIDNDYLILNPDHKDPYIEELPDIYPEKFGMVIMVSVFEHVNNPYEVSDALFKIIKKGGYLFNSTVFQFPHHPCPEDNWRFSVKCLKNIHTKSGFEWVDGDFHLKINANDGVGVPNQGQTVYPQAIWGCFALCRRPE